MEEKELPKLDDEDRQRLYITFLKLANARQAIATKEKQIELLDMEKQLIVNEAQKLYTEAKKYQDLFSADFDSVREAMGVGSDQQYNLDTGAPIIPEPGQAEGLPTQPVKAVVKEKL